VFTCGDSPDRQYFVLLDVDMVRNAVLYYGTEPYGIIKRVSSAYPPVCAIRLCKRHV
jgi:hypothetical protein